MAKRVITQLVDDLDGTDLAEGKGEHIDFAVSGVSYEIDLSAKNAREFHKVLDYYIEHATRTGGRRRTQGRVKMQTSSKRDAAQTRAIREWGIANGYKLSARGRIPLEVEQAYNSAG